MPIPSFTGEDLAAPSAMPFDDEGWRGSGTMLVVEDEETVRTTVGKILIALGFNVVLAVDGHDGVVKFRQDPGKFRLVLLDLTMPRLDGVQVFTELRRINPGIPVVLMSGYGEQEAATRFKGKRLDGFIAKPFDIPSLKRAIRAGLA
jgi:two-component system cell cycle sensor histidine kinase/response regulator CckA